MRTLSISVSIAILLISIVSSITIYKIVGTNRETKAKIAEDCIAIKCNQPVSLPIDIKDIQVGELLLVVRKSDTIYLETFK